MSRPVIETRIVNPLLGSQIPLPEYATDGAAALDLRACMEEPLTIAPGETQIIGSGLAVNIHDPGLVGIIAPRSGLGIRHGIVLANGIGVIDSDYHGEIRIGLRNQGHSSYTVEPGERVCQMLFMPVTQVSLRLVETFSTTTARGEGGLGHTGQH